MYAACIWTGALILADARARCARRDAECVHTALEHMHTTSECVHTVLEASVASSVTGRGKNWGKRFFWARKEIVDLKSFDVAKLLSHLDLHTARGRSGDELLTDHRLLRTQVNADAHKLGRPDNADTYPRAFLRHDATMTDDLSSTVLVDVFTAMFIAARRGPKRKFLTCQFLKFRNWLLR